MLNPADLPTNYWDSEKLGVLWDFVRWFLSFNMPWIMIMAGLLLTFGVLGILVGLFFPQKDDDDDEDDYEVRHY